MAPTPSTHRSRRSAFSHAGSQRQSRRNRRTVTGRQPASGRSSGSATARSTRHVHPRRPCLPECELPTRSTSIRRYPQRPRRPLASSGQPSDVRDVFNDAVEPCSLYRSSATFVRPVECGAEDSDTALRSTQIRHYYGRCFDVDSAPTWILAGMSEENLEAVRRVYRAVERGRLLRLRSMASTPTCLLGDAPEFPDAGAYLGIEAIRDYTRHFLEPSDTDHDRGRGDHRRGRQRGRRACISAGSAAGAASPPSSATSTSGRFAASGRSGSRPSASAERRTRPSALRPR